MMGTTPKGYPYPEGTDLVVDGDDAIQALAGAIDAAVPAGQAAGQGVVSVRNSAAGSTTQTFPAGVFTDNPRIVGTASSSLYNVSASNVSTTSAVLSVRHVNQSETTTTVYVNWIATQPDAMVPMLRAAGRPAVEADVTVECSTAGCGNQGIPIPIASTYIDDDGATQAVTSVECGVCGTDLTDTMQATS